MNQTDDKIRQDNYFLKKAFFDHLLRQGFTAEHIKVYDEYFDLFLDRVGDVKLMDLDPHRIYQSALGSVEELDGEEVIEAYLVLMEHFMGYWAERWEALHPDDEEGEEEEPETPEEEKEGPSS